MSPFRPPDPPDATPAAGTGESRTVILETERLVLREVTAADAEFILGLLNEPSFIENVADRGVRTLDGAREFIATRFTANYRKQGFGFYLVELKEGGASIGICGLARRDFHEHVDIGYSLRPPWWRRGYAIEATRAMQRWALDVLKLPRLAGIVSPGNERSIRLLEKIGLRFDRRMVFPEDGTPVDIYLSAAGSEPLDEECRTTLWRQLGAAVDQLDQAIVACPVELWGDRTQEPEFWYLTYHTLFWLDFCLSESFEGFAPPPPFGLEEMDPAGVLPDRVYTQEELRTYLQHCRRKCRNRIENLTVDSARQRFQTSWLDFSALELLLYNLRHVQHGAGQLNLILRQKANITPPRWVKAAE